MMTKVYRKHEIFVWACFINESSRPHPNSGESATQKEHTPTHIINKLKDTKDHVYAVQLDKLKTAKIYTSQGQ